MEDTPNELENLAQKESWENIRAELRVVLFANEQVVAEVTCPVMWAKILRFIGESTQSINKEG